MSWRGEPAAVLSTPDVRVSSRAHAAIRRRERYQKLLLSGAQPIVSAGIQNRSLLILSSL